MSTDNHIGDTGVVITLTIHDEADAVVNISTATTKQFIFSKPDGTAATVTAVFGTDGSDGVLKYTTLAGDFDKAGNWQVQAKVIAPSFTYHTAPATFIVDANFA